MDDRTVPDVGISAARAAARGDGAMMSAVSKQLTLHQNLVISTVSLVESGITVQLQDRWGEPQWIRFHLSSEQAKRWVGRMTDWRDRCTRLTYVRGPGSGALVDDAELFAAAFG